jgi:Carboxypeptidase regulatory-like domain
MRTIFAATVICVFACALIWAQGGSTAQIHGVVQDASGAAVPGAEVKATQTATGAVRTANSSADGGYVLSNLPIGPYRLEVTKEGFNKFLQEGIVLQVNSDPLIDPALKVGAVSQQVVVEANVSQVETRSSTVGQVIENQRILELPLNGRNVTDLISLAGAAVQVGTTRASMGGGVNPTPLLQVGGGLAYAVAYNLDGTDHMNPNSGGAMPLPFPDALQEFKVDTSGASIDQGKSAGVSAVTKSGTNAFHGDLFEFLRNDLVNAHSYFANGPSTLKRNQFGGTLGGPILKDKLFFFGGFQGTLIRANPGDLEAFLPTQAMLAGDWTTFSSPACNNGRQLNLRGGFRNNHIDPGQFSPVGLKFTNMILANAPAPQDDCGLVRYGQPSRTDEWQGVGRVDYQMSDKHTLFVRYQDLVDEAPNGYTLTPDNVLNTTASGSDNIIQSFALGSTYVFGPTVVNSFRFGAQYANAHNVGADSFSVCDAGAHYYCGNAPHRTYVQTVSGPTVGSSYADPFDAFHTILFSLSDGVSIVRGAHQMSFGFTGSLSRNLSNFNALSPGRITITGQFTGAGLGDLLTGKIAQMIQTATNHMDITSINPTLYASDTWKATRRFTVTASVRWDPFIPQSTKHGGITNFDYTRFNQGITTTQYKYAPAGFYYPGDPGHPGWRGSFNKLWEFAPRLGLAWDVTGDGHTSLRASYAYTYSQVLNYWRQDPFDQNPWSNGTRLVAPVGGLDDPWLGYTYINPDTGATVAGIPFPTVFGRGFTQYGDYISTPYDIQPPQSSSWNLSIQHQFGSDWLVSAAYIGSETSHIWIQDQANPGLVISPLPPNNGTTCGALPVSQCSGQDNTNERRLFTLVRPDDLIQAGTTSLLYSGANLSYNGLLLTAQKRLSRGTSIQMNYTWSHCLGDDVDITSSGPDAGESHTKPGDRAFDRGNCPGDRRHLFNLTVVAQTPQFSARTMRLLASGWTLSGIYRWSSGQPIDISAGSDRALTGQLGFFSGAVYQRADQLSADAYAGHSGPFGQWFNPDAFKPPALGTLGSYTRNSVAYPGTFAFDMALSRSFRVTESQHVEVRAEAFNVTNSFRPGTPGRNFNNAANAQFGQIRTALDPRIMQFALKYVF